MGFIVNSKGLSKFQAKVLTDRFIKSQTKLLFGIKTGFAALAARRLLAGARGDAGRRQAHARHAATVRTLVNLPCALTPPYGRLPIIHSGAKEQHRFRCQVVGLDVLFPSPQRRSTQAPRGLLLLRVVAVPSLAIEPSRHEACVFST